MENQSKRSLFDSDEFEIGRKKSRKIHEKTRFKSLVISFILGVVVGIINTTTRNIFMSLGIDNLIHYGSMIIFAGVTFLLSKNIKITFSVVLGIFIAPLVLAIIVVITSFMVQVYYSI